MRNSCSCPKSWIESGTPGMEGSSLKKSSGVEAELGSSGSIGELVSMSSVIKGELASMDKNDASPPPLAKSSSLLSLKALALSGAGAPMCSEGKRGVWVAGHKSRLPKKGRGAACGVVGRTEAGCVPDPGKSP